MAARALVRGIPGRTFFAGFSNLPLLIPDIVLGISLLLQIALLRKMKPKPESADVPLKKVFAEMPDDPAIGQVRALLASVGFEEEARVPDFYRAGVALTLLRREL